MMASASMQRSNWRVYCVHRHRRGERLPHGERKVGLVESVSGDSPPRTIEFTCFTTGLTGPYEQVLVRFSYDLIPQAGG